MYLNGQVRADAVAGTATTSTTSYTAALKITDVDSAIASASSVWSARTTPTITSPGQVVAIRNNTTAQPIALSCVDGCTVSVTGAPSGIGLATASSNSAVNVTSLSFSGTGTSSYRAYLTGKTSTSATAGSTTIVVTVRDVVGSTTYDISSAGVWTVK